MEDIKKFLKGFTYAARGIFQTIKTERNMRVHLCFMVYMFAILGFTDWFELSKGDWVALILTCAAVIGGELVNTAIENVADLASGGKQNEFVKKAKDAAAGAVLILAIAAVIIGFVILFQPSAFVAMGDYFKSKPLLLIPFLSSIVLSLIFVFKFGKNSKKQ